MTSLATRKTRLSFETDAEVRYRGKMRSIVIEANDTYNATVRLKGTRQRLEISWLAVHDLAAKIAADRERAARKAAPKQRRDV